MIHDGLEPALDRLMQRGGHDLAFHFQPIVEARLAQIIGFEALTRGPADSPLHSPLILFELAARCGRLVDLERMVVRRIVQRFVELKLPGRLFLNVSTDTVMAAVEGGALLATDFSQLGMPSSRIVIEITETRPVLEPARLHSAVQAWRALGLLIAIDDLGAGFSSLRRWVDVRPDYVKIDRHFIDGVAADPVKQQFVRSILEIAQTSGSQVIAEGLELDEDLHVLCEVGVTIFQGYLLARPHSSPRGSMHPDLERRLRALAAPSSSPADTRRGHAYAAARLARLGPTVTPAATCEQVIEMFRREERLWSLPVLDEEGRPIGVLRSMQVVKRATQRYFVELFSHRSCLELMDPHALVFDIATSLQGMSEAVTRIEDHLLVDGFIVTDQGRYVGSGRMTDLLKAVSDLEVSTARQANPLTDLPGNFPIDRHLESLLRQQAHFVVAYWDLSHFKAYNDVYGYRSGDDMIRLTARLVVAATVLPHDFAGHVGGDDFITVMQASGWEERIAAACAGFDAAVVSLIRPEHLRAGGYVTVGRRGDSSFHPLPRLAVGVMRVGPGDFESVHELSAALAEPKQQAKRIRDRSGCFVDRRQRNAATGPAPEACDAAVASAG